MCARARAGAWPTGPPPLLSASASCSPSPSPSPPPSAPSTRRSHATHATMPHPPPEPPAPCRPRRRRRGRHFRHRCRCCCLCRPRRLPCCRRPRRSPCRSSRRRRLHGPVRHRRHRLWVAAGDGSKTGAARCRSNAGGSAVAEWHLWATEWPPGGRPRADRGPPAGPKLGTCISGVCGPARSRRLHRCNARGAPSHIWSL
jgi:hypothetical protein